MAASTSMVESTADHGSAPIQAVATCAGVSPYGSGTASSTRAAAGFHSLTLGSEVPSIESVLINRPGEDAMGAGETAITLVASAVGNAIFDATGARIRQVPFTPERVKAALAQRS